VAWDTLRFLQGLHGHVAWLAAALLLHPPLVLRVRPAQGNAKRARQIVLIAALVTSATYMAGLALYTDYRATVRRPLFEAAPAFGWCFERKEHLATLALGLAWVGVVTIWRVPLGAAEAAHAASHRRAGRVMLAAGLFAIATALLGTAVASIRSL
jgi:hypothetical protein